MKLEEYTSEQASEKHHLPFSYEKVTKHAGWNKVGRNQGVTSFYEKQGKRIMITALNNDLFIRAVPEKAG